MKILLMGEYSGVFTELNKGFKAAGHETFIITNGDNYKKYNSNLNIDFSKKHSNFILKLIHFILFRFGLDGLLRLQNKWKYLKPHLSGYDAVLLVNPIVEDHLGSFANLLILRYVFKHNKSVFLSVLGDDYYVAKYYSKHCLQNGFYNSSIADFVRPKYQFKYKFCLGYKFVNDYVIKHVKAVIPGTPTYSDSYYWCGKVEEVMPFPLSENKIGLPLHIKENEPVIIFHGWQKGKEARKGNDIIDHVIRKVVCYYGKSRVKYQVVSNVPFNEYVKMFNSSHIFIDQLYAQDKGFNGLLGMAAGKVVFSGFKKEVLSKYKDFDGREVGISASNDQDDLFKQFCDLIENPSRMETISVNAIEFVKKYHLSKNIIIKYLNIFNKYK